MFPTPKNISALDFQSALVLGLSKKMMKFNTMDSVIKLGPQKSVKTLVHGGASPGPQLQGMQTIRASGPVFELLVTARTYSCRTVLGCAVSY